jgi:hypothetical protein
MRLSASVLGPAGHPFCLFQQAVGPPQEDAPGGCAVGSGPEASGCLVAPPVFKTGEPCTARLAGSIPVRLRHRAAPATVR